MGAVSATQGDQTRTVTAALPPILVPELDELLTARIAAFQNTTHQIEALTALTVLLVAYLLVGFSRSATVPLRTMVGALNALAEGDLTQQVRVDTAMRSP